MSPLRICLTQATNPVDVRWNAALGFGYLKAYVERQLPGQCEFLAADTWEQAAAWRPDVLGIASTSQDFEEAQRLCQAARRIGIPVIVLGGFHVTAFPETLPREADLGVLGEGEVTFAEVLSLLVRSGALSTEGLATIPGLVYWDDAGTLRQTARRTVVAQLDDLPPPDHWFGLAAGRQPYLFTSRGCPYHCSFCASSVYWPNVRFHSAERVITELETILERQPDLEGLSFWDDLFAADRKRLRRIVELFEARPHLRRLSLGSSIRANLISDELCDSLKRLHYRSVGFGAESGSDAVLKKLKDPRYSAGDNQRALDTLQRNGLGASAGFVLGHPEETEADVHLTYQFILSNYAQGKLSRHDITILTPMPGTDTWRWAEQNGFVRKEGMEWHRLRYLAMYSNNLKGIDDWVELRERNGSIYLNDHNVPRGALYQMIRHYEDRIRRGDFTLHAGASDAPRPAPSPAASPPERPPQEDPSTPGAPASVATPPPNDPAGPRPPEALPTYYLHRREEIVAAVPEAARSILDVGCGGGALGRALKEASPSRRVVGIEVVPRAAEAARHHLDEVLEADADTLEPPFAEGEFDCIVFADVLEHLRDPWAAASRFLRFLRPGGTVVASIPNIRRLSVLQPLAESGQWEYQSEGILDRTHLRFFTRTTFTRLLEAAGVPGGTIEPLGGAELDGYRPGPDGRLRMGRIAIEGVSEADFDELAAVQFLFVGRKPEAAGGDAGGWRAVPPRGAPERAAAPWSCVPAIADITAAASPALAVSRALAFQLRRPPVSIVIPVWNKVEYTQRCLEAIIENTPPELYECVIVDNGSTDATPELLARLDGDTRVIRNQKNEGFVVACNQGAAAARGKYVLFLNNDTTPQPGWLEALIATAEADPRVGAVGSKLVYPDGNLQEAGGIIFSDGTGWNFGKGGDPRAAEHNEPCEVDYCSGASLLVRKELFDKLGGFDLRYAPAYYEDTDLCFGVRWSGHTVRYCPTSVVIHHEGITAGTSTAAGMKQYQVVNHQKFCQKWVSELRQQPEPPSRTGRRPVSSSRERRAIQSAEQGAVLVIDPQMPVYDKASGSLRLFRILELLRAQRRHVTFIARNGWMHHTYRRPLEAMGIEVHTSDPERMAQIGYYVPGPRVDLGRILTERHFDLAWLSFYYIAEQYLPWIRTISPRTTVVADTVDVHFLREMREAELRKDPNAIAAARQTRARELSIYGACDLVVTVTQADAQQLVQRKVQTPWAVVPNIHLPHAGPVPGHSARQGLVFVGGFGHPPNVDAAKWLVREILPRVREARPDIPLLLVGSNPPDEVKALADRGIEVTGFVPETGPYLDAARVSVAPLRYGAGMKGKVGEALGRGIPVVTTAIGAEGMGLSHEQHVLIADTPQAFAEQILRVYEDAALWERLSAAGRTFIDERYGPEAAGRALAEIVERAQQGVLRRVTAA